MKRHIQCLGLVASMVVAGCDGGTDKEKEKESGEAAPAKSSKVEVPLDAEAKKQCGSQKGESAAKCLAALADKRMHAGEDQKAADALVAAVRQVPKSASAWVKLAGLMLVADDDDTAVQVLAQAKCHVAEKDRAPVHALLSNIHQDAGRLDEAIGELAVARTLDPKDPTTAFNLGMSYLKLTPPKKSQGVRELDAFVAMACKDADDKRNEAECAQAQRVLGMLEGSSAAPPETTSKPAGIACGKEVVLPKIEVEKGKIKDGDDYTVWGASHHLRSLVLNDLVTRDAITIVGHVVATNYADAPACAVFPAGSKDTPADCVAPIPQFSIADKAGGKRVMIKVMGWSTNWSQLYTLMTDIDEAKGEPVERLDPWTGLAMPVPVPNIGAKVRITGMYRYIATVGTRGVVTNPRYGIITPEKIETLTPAPRKAVLPGLERTK